MTFDYYEKYHLHEYVDKKGTSYPKVVTDNKIATLINEIITSLERLIISIRTLYANIKESFKKEKSVII